MTAANQQMMSSERNFYPPSDSKRNIPTDNSCAPTPLKFNVIFALKHSCRNNSTFAHERNIQHVCTVEDKVVHWALHAQPPSRDQQVYLIRSGRIVKWNGISQCWRECVWREYLTGKTFHRLNEERVEIWTEVFAVIKTNESNIQNGRPVVMRLSLSICESVAQEVRINPFSWTSDFQRVMVFNRADDSIDKFLPKLDIWKMKDLGS